MTYQEKMWIDEKFSKIETELQESRQKVESLEKRVQDLEEAKRVAEEDLSSKPKSRTLVQRLFRR